MSEPLEARFAFGLVQGKRGPAPKASCCVYLVVAPNETLKIGMSNSPAKRLNGLRTSSHEQLALGRWWRLISRERAAALEGTLHRLFKPLRKAREWFDLLEREAASVCAAVLAGDAERSGALAAAICEYRLIWARRMRLSARRDALSHRWRGEERARIMEEMEDLLGQYSALYRTARILGLERADWDEVLDTDHTLAPSATAGRLTR